MDMKLSDIFVLKHELWLKYLFVSFAIKDNEVRDILYEFANIEFRHLKWLGQKLYENNEEFKKLVDEDETLKKIVEFSSNLE